MTLEQEKQTSFGKLQELLGEPRGQMLMDGYFVSNDIRNVFLEQLGEPQIEDRWVSGMTDSDVRKLVTESAEHFLRCICSPLITE